MPYALTTHQLSYRFSSHETILESLNLQVPQGSIYGFLGPNGAGKTTTLKLILGLLRRQQGDISVLGQSPDANRLQVLQKIGALIETPSLYGQLTAMENLEVWRRIYRTPRKRIAEVLPMVGLADTRNKKARQFSLGMKQRLSIAVAILHKPSLLILDEPTNGLDPRGMIDMRKLLRRLNQEEGMTILLSSHLLSEIARLVSHVGVINGGKLIFQGTLQTLLDKRTAESDDLETIFIDLINQA